MAKNVVDLIEDELGVNVGINENPELTQIGTSAAILFRQNPNRVAAVVVNLSNNVLFVSPGGGVSTSKGIRLGANGGSMSLSWRDDFTLPAKEWTIISDVGTNNLYSLEVLTQ